MIKEFVDRFMARKEELRERFEVEPPSCYKSLVYEVMKVLEDEEDTWESPDPERIHEIDDGDYRGTLVYVIPSRGYQPSDYWYVFADYGSCSGCDTLAAIAARVTLEQQLDDYMQLALHIVQRMKKME